MYGARVPRLPRGKSKPFCFQRACPHPSPFGPFFLAPFSATTPGHTREKYPRVLVVFLPFTYYTDTHGSNVYIYMYMNTRVRSFRSLIEIFPKITNGRFVLFLRIFRGIRAFRSNPLFFFFDLANIFDRFSRIRFSSPFVLFRRYPVRCSCILTIFRTK